MYQFLLTIHVIISLMLIGVILLQHGKGAQAGVAFGSGASQTVFGSQGTSGFLTRATTLLATLFFVLNLLLAFIVNKASHQNHVMEMPVQGESHSSKEGSDIPDTPKW